MNDKSKILIVDDEPHIRIMLRKLFEGLGITDIREAHDGIEACELYAGEPADLVIMDINMPRLDGIEALKAITATDPDAAVVMLTSLGTRRAVEESAESGASYYLRKDTPMPELRQKLQRLLADLYREDD